MLKKMNMFKICCLFSYIPLLTCVLILTIFTSYNTSTKLKKDAFDKLEASAVSVQKYFEWDIREDILEKDDVSEDFIDSLQKQNIELTLFEKDTRWLTSVRREDGKRNNDTKCDSKIWETVQKGEIYTDEHTKINGDTYFVCYVPVEDEEGNVWGMAFAGEKAYKINNIVKEQVLITVGLSIGISIFFIFIVSLGAKAVVKPLNTVANEIEDMSKGNVSKEVTAKGNVKELKILTDGARTLQENLSSSILEVKNTSNLVNNESEEIEELTKEANTISGEIVYATNELNTASMTMAEEVQSINEKIIKMGSDIDIVSLSANKLGDVSENIKETNEIATKKLKEVVNNSKISSEAIKDINEKIEDTNETIKTINETVSLILGIAHKTKLLALNASIEAARAGDNGKGFAVVAEDIGVLSVQSGEGASKIKDLADKITDKSLKMVESSLKVIDLVDKEGIILSETIDGFNELSNNIEISLEEIDNVLNLSNNLNITKDEVISNVSNLSAISEENAANNEQVSHSIAKVSESINIISEKSNTLKEYSGQLKEKVSIFN